MTYIPPKRAWCTPVPTAAKYQLFLLTQGATFVQDPTATGYVEPLVTVDADPAATDKQQIPLPAGIAEGVYDVYICAVDAAGNVSDPLELAASSIDLTAPAAPTAGGFD